MSTLNGVDQDVFAGFLEETTESLEAVVADFMRLEKDPSQVDALHAIMRAIHSIKGNAPFFGLHNVKELAHEMESKLIPVRENTVVISSALVTVILRGLDEVKEMLARVASGKAEVANASKHEDLLNSIKEFKYDSSGSSPKNSPSLRDRSSAPIESKNIAEPPVAALVEPPEAPLVTHQVKKTLRIEEERIDRFLSSVGELIIIAEGFHYAVEKLKGLGVDSSIMHELHEVEANLQSLNSEMEEAVMEIRQTNIKPLLSRVSKILRDVAASTGKLIDISLVGEDLEVDKSLIELLDAPLVHMARNAADHGIELPEDREKKGKDPKGKIVLRCFLEEKMVIVEVSDDGKGLDREAIRRKAEEIGAIKNGATLTDEDIVNLIFCAGLSTAKQVSDISGRGVGMDVVKKNIEKAGGSIAISSTQGTGSTFRIELPRNVRTKILEGYVVEVGGTRLVIPCANVLECWRPAENEAGAIFDQADYVTRHGAVLPLLNVAQLLNLKYSNDTPLIVNIRQRSKLVAIKVDQVHGIRRLVLKEMEGVVTDCQLIEAATLLGDGTVGFVVSVDKLIAS